MSCVIHAHSLSIDAGVRGCPRRVRQPRAVDVVEEGRICRRVFDSSTCYPHMPIGKVWIYRLLFCYVCVILFFVCTVTDFPAEDKASGVKFCTAVYRRPG